MDANGNPSTIKLISPRGLLVEGKAAGAIKPGHLIEKDSNGEYVVHATANGRGSRTWATEDVFQGKTINDAYADNDFVRGWTFLPGDTVYAYLKAGENVAIDDELISGGDGTLIKSTGTVLQTFGKAKQAMDLSGGGAVATRIRVEVL